MQNNENDVLLRVEHLCQYFKMGPGRELKAVDDVSFDIKKGEVFGLVGESGCGKTTTGRSIIKLYDITSGNVYFKDQRICAGVRSYKDAIKKAKTDFSESKKALRERMKDALKSDPEKLSQIKSEYAKELAEKKAELKKIIAEQKKLIRSAKNDHKNCEKIYFKKLKEEYAEVLEKAGGNTENLSEDDKEKYRVVINQPKIPKRVWLITAISLFAAAVIFLAVSIAQYVIFNNNYGTYTSVSSVVWGVDAEAGTTYVTYSVTDEDGVAQEYEATLDYYDPDLAVSTDAQLSRLRIYYDTENPENVVPFEPVPTAGNALLITFFVSAAIGLVIVLYVNERYNPSKLVTQIQMIFQDPIASLDPRMTVKDIIAEGLVIEGVKDKKYIEKQVYDVLELVGLVPEHAGRYPHEFSGGQRQRIGIARAIITKPKMVIADEPVSALDVSVQAQVINLLNDLKEEMGLTILFIAHNLSVVKYFSDRIGVMYYGHLVEVANGDDLYAKPLHPYTKALLSAIPEPNPITERTRQRVDYDPERDHDYSNEKPSMVEVEPEHFVYCSPSELAAYREQLKG